MIREAPYRLGTNQTASYTSTSAPITTAFQQGVNVVRLLSSTSCHVKFGSSPVATVDDPRLAANVPEYFVVSPGQKVAAIRTTTSGTLHVSVVSG
jgi:hypothetical protein